MYDAGYTVDNRVPELLQLFLQLCQLVLIHLLLDLRVFPEAKETVHIFSITTCISCIVPSYV